MTDIASSILAAFPSLSPSNTLNLYTLFYPLIFTKENHMLTRELLASYIDAGAGRIKADMAVLGGTLINVNTG